ncbi:MAG: 50S ribosomal protein L15 [candidate division WOR-3 bacterium]|nr:MAG: 50S ribosomal protein L15 [candidate division WOR-3 bacterium]
MKLNELKPDPGARKKRRRVGCGPGSGLGKTSGRGNKGAGQHSASEFDERFEGGQMPLYRRIPKRGFNNVNRVEYAVVNLDRLADLETDSITVELLREKGLVRKGMRVKVLGNGEVGKALTVTAHAFTKSARDKIEKAGGRAEVIA